MRPDQPAVDVAARRPSAAETSGVPRGVDLDEAPTSSEHLSLPRRLLGSAGLAAVVASALLGSNMFAVRDRLLGSATPLPAPAASSREAGATSATTAPAPTRLRSQPWWQEVTTLVGMGAMTAPAFTIGEGAIQWRVRWTCSSGHLVVQAPPRPKPLVDAACGGGEDGFSTSIGQVRMKVSAEGAWKLQVEQQVDVPLAEPPLASMTAPGAGAVARGGFYRIDQSTTGTVTVYRQADGSHALRLDDFFVSPNSDLEVRLSPLKAPHSSGEYSAAPSELVAKLDVTTGSLNFSIPATIDPGAYSSVVIWCRAVNSAYGAATLAPAE